MLTLMCLIEGETIVFPVIAVRDGMVGELKELVQSKRALGRLKDIDPHTLELWKVSAIEEPLCEMTMTLLFSAQGLHLYRPRASRHSR